MNGEVSDIHVRDQNISIYPSTTNLLIHFNFTSYYSLNKAKHFLSSTPELDSLTSLRNKAQHQDFDIYHVHLLIYFQMNWLCIQTFTIKTVDYLTLLNFCACRTSNWKSENWISTSCVSCVLATILMLRPWQSVYIPVSIGDSKT